MLDSEGGAAAGPGQGARLDLLSSFGGASEHGREEVVHGTEVIVHEYRMPADAGALLK